jgi:hypothetical protein
MAKIQEKLKESLDKQNSMTSMDRLAKTLGTSLADGVAACVNNDNSMIMEVDDNNNNGNNNGSNISDKKNAIDACDSMTPKIAIVEEKEQQQEKAPLSFKGENKAVIRGKKWKKNKLAIASLQKKQQSSGTTSGGSGSSSRSSSSSRPKPRFFCQF